MDSIAHYKRVASAETPLTVWHEAFGIVLARPLTGCSYKSTATPSARSQTYPNAPQPAVHDVWREVLSENGFPAFFMWPSMLLLKFLNIRCIRRRARSDPALAWADDFARMAQVTLIALVTAGTFLSMACYDLYFSLLVALAATREITVKTVKVSKPEDAAQSAPVMGLVPAAVRTVVGTRWEDRAGAVSGWRLRCRSR